MAIPNIDMTEGRVAVHKRSANAHVAVPLPQPINCGIDPLPLIPFLILRIQRQLDIIQSFHKDGTSQTNTADRPPPCVIFLKKGKAYFR